MNNILFIWIPKTGGTSVYNALKEKIGMKLHLDENYDKFCNYGSVTFGHADIRSILAKQIIIKQYWNSCFPFTIVRNPYSRFVSLYNDFKKSRRIAPDTTVKEFADVIQHYTRKPGPYNVLDYSQAASQVAWIVPGVKIFKMENLKEEIQPLFDIKLPHDNVSTYGNWIDYYTRETLEMITDIYYDDITLLNYDIIN